MHVVDQTATGLRIKCCSQHIVCRSYSHTHVNCIYMYICIPYKRVLTPMHYCFHIRFILQTNKTAITIPDVRVL